MSQSRVLCKLIVFLEVLVLPAKKNRKKRLGAVVHNANYTANIYLFEVNKETCEKCVTASWCLYC